MGDDKRTSDDDDAGDNALEWAVAGISSLIVVAMIGFLVLEALDAAESRPLPVAEVADIAPIQGGYRVEINAMNNGGTTAASVRFRATLERGGQTVETAEVTFDFLPAQSSREGAVIFANDPDLHDLVIQAESYTAP
jgi:uncharacterized protein (TIGR02588 family)